MRCGVAAASAIARAERGETRDERSAGDRGGGSWWSAEPLELAAGDGKDDPRGTIRSIRGNEADQPSAHKGAANPDREQLFAACVAVINLQ